MLWFYSTKDPLSGENSLPHLEPERTGERSLHLYEASRPLPKQPEALKWLVASNSVVLPTRHTLYWCTMLKLPDLPGKHHMIGYKPVLSPGSQR